jgi:hypothetical protein
MLDPDPRVHELGVAYLRSAGVEVDFFPADLRQEIVSDNAAFIQQFHASPTLLGEVSFNFTDGDGFYTLGHGPLTFKTRWTNAGSAAIHVYTDGTGLRGLAVALTARALADIRDASAYDMSSRVRTPTEGQFVIFQNEYGHFAVVKVVDVKARSHGDPYDALTLAYRINPDGSARFDE